MSFPNPAWFKVVSVSCLPNRAQFADSAARRCVLFISFLLLILPAIVLPANAAPEPTTRRVLILTGTDPNHPGFSSITQALRSILRNSPGSRVEFVYELQSGFSGQVSPQDDQHLITYLKEKYQNQKIDLIYSMAAPRLRVLLQNEPTLFAAVPKVFYEFESEREPTLRELGTHATGVWARVELNQTLDLALTLHPDTKRVIVIAGNSATERSLM